MYYFLTASKDASVYLQQPDQNTGLDQILEISKVYYGNLKDVSRSFLKFDTDLPSYVTMSEATLMLRETESEEVPLEFEIYGYMVSQSWEMGIGTRFDEISTAGITWNYREGDSKDKWLPVSGWLTSNVFASGSTGSYAGLGGTWYTGSSTSQKFNYLTTDLNMDVTEMLHQWVSGNIPNDGIILKYADDKEGFVDLDGSGSYDINDYGILKFFSKETHTIHQPKIRIGWDDSDFITGSLNFVGDGSIKVAVKGLKNEYKLNTVSRIRISARELYPLKTFSSTFVYNTSNYLPQSTYYQVRDLLSDTIIVPFSEYTKVSCDENGNYFDLNFINWEAGRDYKIEFKVERDGLVDYFDNDNVFSLVK
jgi:hypothetical protein